jgi:hypothetical protein
MGFLVWHYDLAGMAKGELWRHLFEHGICFIALRTGMFSYVDFFLTIEHVLKFVC